MLRRILTKWGMSTTAAAILASCVLKTQGTCDELLTCPPEGSGGQAGTGGNSTGGAGTGGSAPEGGTAPVGTGGTESAGMGGEGGMSGAAGAGGGGAGGCDTTLSPSEAPCLVSSAHALFVAPSGSDDADGTRAAPLQTISRALELAAGSDKIIVACIATYEEPVAIATGVRLYGGFACPDDPAPWTYQKDLRTKIMPSEPGVALEIRNVVDEIVLEDFEFEALDAI